MVGPKKKTPLWKSILAHLVLWPLLFALSFLVLPLFYLAFLFMSVLLPPLVYLLQIHEKFTERTPISVREELYRLVSYLLFFPLALLAMTAVLRSLTLFLFSLFSPALIVFQQIHHDLIYGKFIPHFGDLFPYWLDLYWGAGAVVVFLVMGMFDSWKRSILVRQIRLLPTSKIHAAAIGLVELKGKAVPIKSGRKDPIMRDWTDTSGEGVSFPSFAHPFYVDDGTGRVPVDPRGCGINQADSLFSVNIHQVVLAQKKDTKGLSEGRLMPGEKVYVLGNLQINDDPEFADDKVIVRPVKSTLLHPKFHDVFFVSDKNKDALLEAFHRVRWRGWMKEAIMLCIAGWMAIYGWTNITQLKFHELDAAPAAFRLLTTKTELERPIEVDGLGTRPLISWIDDLESGSPDTDDIMYELQEQLLAPLAVDALAAQALEIESPGFASAHYWLKKLERYPEGLWGHQYFRERHMQTNISREGNREAFVYRVVLRYDEPALRASWKAWYSEYESKHRVLVQKTLVFRFRDVSTGAKYTGEMPLQPGWNIGDDELVLDSIPPGTYEFHFYVKRLYKGGRKDQGSRKSGKFVVELAGANR